MHNTRSALQESRSGRWDIDRKTGKIMGVVATWVACKRELRKETLLIEQMKLRFHKKRKVKNAAEPPAR